MNFKSQRQFVFHLGDFVFEVVAELHVVAAVSPGYGDADGGGAVEIHFGLGRVGVVAFYVRDVAEVQRPAVAADGDIRDFCRRVRDARQPQECIVAVFMEHGRGGDAGLGVYDRCQRVNVHPQLREFVVIYFDIDFLGLHAEQLDFLNILYAFERVLEPFGDTAHILVRVAVRCDRVDIAVHVVEMVVVIWPLKIGGQLVLAVLDEVAQLDPSVAHCRCRG